MTFVHDLVKEYQSDKGKQIIFMLMVFACLWIMYNITYRKVHGDIFGKTVFYKVPMGIKCLFGERRCEQGNIDGWTFLHAFMYLIIGYCAPNMHKSIFAISVLFEGVEPLLGYNAKFIVDVGTNFTAYSVGSYLGNNGFAEKNK